MRFNNKWSLSPGMVVVMVAVACGSTSEKAKAVAVPQAAGGSILQVNLDIPPEHRAAAAAVLNRQLQPYLRSEPDVRAYEIFST